MFNSNRNTIASFP